MEIVGYIAYATIVILALVWTIDVRANLGSDSVAVLRAVYFILATALIPSFGINLGHCLWLAPLGCLFARFFVPVLIKIPVVSLPFIAAACTFERLIHLGMPRLKIKQDQSAAMNDGVCSINN